MRLTLAACLPSSICRSARCRKLSTCISGRFSCICSRKNLLIAILITGFTVITLVQKHLAASELRHLLKYEFAESPARHTARTKHLTDTNDSNTYGSSVDERIDYFEPSRCPRSIASLPRHSQWFRERFRPSIKLFLDKYDSNNISNLSFYELPFGFQNENHTLISSLLRQGNFMNPPLRLRQTKDCISCAVVGAGGILNGSLAGREIDSHDLVFRLNKAKTTGKYTKDVGRKTDFYMFFPESARLGTFKDENVTLLYTMFKSFDVNYVAEMFGVNSRPSRVKADPNKLKIIHPDFFRYVFAKFLDGKSMKPTTGAVVVLLSIHLCDAVTIYGFGYDPRYTLHYYDQRFQKHTYKSTWTHDVENEKRLWDKLHHEGAIRFFNRDT